MARYSLLRLFMMLFFFSVIVFTGIFRLYYIVNLTDTRYPFFLKRELFALQDLNSAHSLWESFFYDPRWLSNGIYILTSFIASVSLVYFAFLQKKYVWTTLIVYLLIGILLFVFEVLNMIVPDFKFVDAIAQKINMIVQSPMPAIFLVAAFYLDLKLGEGLRDF